MLQSSRLFMDRALRYKERFLGALANGREVQRELLRKTLVLNADTAFGRDHGFASITNLNEYRRAVPLRGYDELRPYIDRAVAGEPRVLTAADPILYFVTTGTTGAPKRVPIIRDSFGHLAANQMVFWHSLGERYPKLLERDDTIVMLHLAPKPYKELSPTGVPLLNPTHLPSEGTGAFPYSRAPWYPPPAELSDADRLYYFLRSTVSRSLLGFLCLHPSRMQSFASRLAHDGPLLVRELHDGTMFGAPYGEPDPARAKQLEAVIAGGTLEPRHVWPELEFIACWYGGSFKMYEPGIEERYDADVIPHMSASSEAGHITLPFDGERIDGPLTLHANFYEFIPVTDDGDEPQRRDGADTLTFEELELGRTYELVLTSPSGLYRYASGDTFEVQGFVNGVPRIGFVGRGGVVDMTGEKLTEQHVQAAINHTLAAHALTSVAATCCAVLGPPAHYVFVFEPRAAWSTEIQQRVAATLDAELRRLNSRFELKRGFGDLGAPQLRIAAPGAFDRYRASLIARGAPGTQLKDKLLQTDRAVLAALTEP